MAKNEYGFVNDICFAINGSASDPGIVHEIEES
jgi:hypothetical protein